MNSQSILILSSALLVLQACGSAEPPPPPDVYQVRGLVRQLPSGPTQTVFVWHEPIPEFKDIDGEVVGMEAMSMPFAVADPALLDGIAAGDRVVVDLEVRWQGKDPLRITTLEKLPPDTRLEFEKDETNDEDPAETPAEDAAPAEGTEPGAEADGSP